MKLPIRFWTRKSAGAYRLSILGGLFLLAFAGILTGPMTDRRSLVTWWRARVSSPPEQDPVYTGRIEPILRKYCVSCHGPEKQKADLRLDSLAQLLLGGQDGPAVKPGRARDSLLIQRMLLPEGSDNHMPPEDQPQPTSEETALVEIWVNMGLPACGHPRPQMRGGKNVEVGPARVR